MEFYHSEIKKEASDSDAPIKELSEMMTTHQNIVKKTLEIVS